MKKLENINRKEIGLSSGAKVLINVSLCGYYTIKFAINRV